MNIVLNKTEIQEALSSFIASKGISIRNMDVTLSGIEDDASIEVAMTPTVKAPVKKAPVKRTPRAKKAAPEVAKEEVVEEVTEESADDVAAEMEGKSEPAPTKKAAPKKKSMFGN